MVEFPTKKKKSRNYKESQVQKSFLIWLKWKHPHIRKLVIRIKNEQVCTPYMGKVDKEMGLHPGASDLFIAHCTKRHAGLWLEVKPDDFKITPSKMGHYQKQLDFILSMRAEGYWGDIGVGLDECIKIFERYIGADVIS